MALDAGEAFPVIVEPLFSDLFCLKDCPTTSGTASVKLTGLDRQVRIMRVSLDTIPTIKAIVVYLLMAGRLNYGGVRIGLWSSRPVNQKN